MIDWQAQSLMTSSCARATPTARDFITRLPHLAVRLRTGRKLAMQHPMPMAFIPLLTLMRTLLSRDRIWKGTVVIQGSAMGIFQGGRVGTR